MSQPYVGVEVMAILMRPLVQLVQIEGAPDATTIRRAAGRLLGRVASGALNGTAAAAPGRRRAGVRTPRRRLPKRLSISSKRRSRPSPAFASEPRLVALRLRIGLECRPTHRLVGGALLPNWRCTALPPEQMLRRRLYAVVPPAPM